MNAVSKLVNRVGESIVAYITGATDRSLVTKWVDGTATPDIDQLEAIVFTNLVFEQIATVSSGETARAFLIDQMDDGTSPIAAIREGRTNSVQAHKRRFLDGE